jgi:hypothetical protein
MRGSFPAKVFHALFFLLLCGSRVSAQQPANCIHIFFCLFDQEAAASDSVGIHKYSRDVADLILPSQWTYGRSPAGRMEQFEDEFLGEKYAANLADRLARAEQTARTGNGKLVALSDVVRAFNDLMKEVGAPSSVRTDENTVQKFREHAAAIKAFPALFSADRNGTNCNPAEAVFILGLLMMDNGVLYERNLDMDLALMHPEAERGEGWMSFGVVSTVRAPDSRQLILSYPADHGRRAGISLFNHVADTLGF